MNRLVALLAAGLCAGCAGSVLTSANEAPALYRLEASTISPGGDELPLALVVSRPRALSSLDTDRIAVVRPGGGFDYFADVRWADPAPQMLQGLLVRAIDADGRFAAVVAAPSRVPADLMLDVELRSFEANYAGGGHPPQIRVEMQVSLVDVRKGARIASFGSASVSDAADDRRPAVVAAFEQATGDALQLVVARIREAASGAVR